MSDRPHERTQTVGDCQKVQDAVWAIIHGLQLERWRLSAEDRALAEKHFWELTS